MLSAKLRSMAELGGVDCNLGPFGDNGGKSAFCRCKKGVFDQKSGHFYPKSAYLESKFGHVSV